MLNHLALEEQNVFIISDIHGMNDELQLLLTKVPKDTKVLFLGDYIDRGKYSKEVLDTVMSYVKEGKGYAILGNHELMCLDAINESVSLPILNHYLQVGGSETIKSFTGIKFNKYKQHILEHLTEIKSEFNKEFSENGDYHEFIKNLPYFITMGDLLFIHAGVSPYTESLEDIIDDDALWVRDEFHYNQHTLPYKVFFGHTIREYLPHIDLDLSIWVNPTRSKFGIDGGCFKGGYLNGVYIDMSTRMVTVHQAYKDFNGTLKHKLGDKEPFSLDSEV